MNSCRKFVKLKFTSQQRCKILITIQKRENQKVYSLTAFNKFLQEFDEGSRNIYLYHMFPTPFLSKNLKLFIMLRVMTRTRPGQDKW